jgi:2-methylcitrate dehydratase PrpD
MTEMDLSAIVASHAATVPLENISQRAWSTAKKSTLDTIGCMLAAAQDPGADVMIGLAREWGGRGEASVVGSGFAAPAPLAAWINGYMARALEIDDCTDFRALHPSAVIVPALLALAEARGGISGREYLGALAIGQDLLIRLALTTRQDGIKSGRYCLFKIFATTGAAARALRLDPIQTQHAMGIAYGSASGESQSALEGTPSFHLHEGNTCQGALLAALMAARGFRGPKDFLLGRGGLFSIFEPDPILDSLTKDLGSYFWGEEISYKPFASCRATHAAVGLLVDYARKMHPDPSQVKAVRITVAPHLHKLIGGHLDDLGDSVEAAQFSLSYTAAAALVCGDMFFKQLTPESIKNPVIRSLARRIQVVPDENMTDPNFINGRTQIEVEMEGQPKVVLHGSKAMGGPANPVGLEEIAEKVRKCAAAAQKPLPAATIERVIEVVAALESVEDVAEVAQLLRGQDR